MQETKKKLFSNQMSLFVLLGSIILLPIFFLPYVPVALGSTKGILFALGGIVALVFWFISRLIEGVIVLPKSKIVLFAWAIPTILLISALFSKSFGNSFVGQGFDVGTISIMLGGAIIVFLGSMYFNKIQSIKLIIGVYVAGMIALALSVVKFFLSPQALSFGGVLYGKIGNVVGSWNDLGLFAGILLVISLVMIEIMSSSRKAKLILTILSLLPLFILIAVGSVTSWVLVGLATLLLFVYSLSFGHFFGEKREKFFPTRSFVVILVSLFFIVANSMVGNLLPSYLGLGSAEVRPSVSSTFSIVRHTLAKDPILGVGPNNFGDAWALYKPQVINTSQFWNTSFSTGFGFIPTFLVTSGVLGVLAWLLFIISFLFSGIKALGKKNGDNGNLIFVSVVASLYLLGAMFVSAPNILIIALFFVFIGIFLGLTVTEKSFTFISFLDDPRKSFFSILGIIAAVVIIFIIGFGYIKKFSGIVLVGSGINRPNTAEGVQQAERNLVRGAVLSADDFAYRALSQFYLIRLGDLLGKTSESQQEGIKPELQSLLSKSETSVQTAINYNPNNFLNWLSLGGVYDALVPLKIEKSYENAKSAYEKALTLNPHNPSIYLRLARLEASKGDIESSREYISKSLVEKQNYADAYLLLGAIEEQAGNKDAAINQFKNAVLSDPSNSGIALRLGVAFYESGQYIDSVSAFERAVVTNPSSVDARYYLGLAYSKVGRTADAITQLKIIQSVFPENTEIKTILERLESGSSFDTAETATTTEEKDVKKAE